MARVEWTRQSGEEVEAAVGMLLCSRFPNAVRVRPSQGDGGIDVFVPGPAGWAKQRVVWQIKRYCHNLGGTEKRAVQRSLARVVETSNDEGWQITEWHLVMPLDLTDKNLGWLEAYAEQLSIEFRCETIGLLLCDTMAADYPKVIDYYFRDGKDRLQGALDDLSKILSHRLDREQNDQLIPVDVMPDLASIYRALNACDPFYKYSFEVSDQPPPDAVAPTDDALIAAYAICQDSVWVTFKIYALSLAALQERLIVWRLQLAVPTGNDELRQHVEKFIEHGAPLSMPPGTVKGFLDLPGGLGADISGASLQVIDVVDHSPDGNETALAIAMLEPDSDTVIASTTIKRTELTVGQTGGVRSMWTDEAELFTIEMLAKDGQPRELTWNFRQEDRSLAGRRPADIVDSLKFMGAMHEPNRIGIGLPYGPKEFTSGGTTPYRDRDMNATRLGRVAECLALIQDHVSVLLKMPAEITKNQALAIIDAATLTSGETQTGSINGTVTIIRDGEQLEPQRDTAYEFTLIRPLQITLDDDEINLGKHAMFFVGKYVEISDAEVVVEPLSEYVAGRYSGELEPGRVLVRPARAITQAVGTTPEDPRH